MKKAEPGKAGILRTVRSVRLNRICPQITLALSIRHSREGGNPVFSEVLDCPVKPDNDETLNSVSSEAQGFTLLEIMIALAIVGGLLVTLLYSLNYHLGIAQRHETLTIASMLARDKIAQIEKSPSESKGEFPAPYEDYRYTTEVREAPYPGMSEVSVTVGKGDENVKLTELIEKPR
jgi:general secretion pathway protein I